MKYFKNKVYLNVLNKIICFIDYGALTLEHFDLNVCLYRVSLLENDFWHNLQIHGRSVECVVRCSLK